MIVDAVLCKRITSDGLVEVEDHVQIGKVYRVNLATRRMANGRNFIEHVTWRREIINDVNGTWFPTELLQIDNE